VALHLPGGSIMSYARKFNMQFPPSAFTVEGWVKVAPGSGGRFMFSYNVVGNDNCILVQSTVGTYGVWVHWGMTVAATGAIRHYINGTITTTLGGGTFCRSQNGALVLGQDQVRRIAFAYPCSPGKHESISVTTAYSFGCSPPSLKRTWCVVCHSQKACPGSGLSSRSV
jgi:hypothetical protein